MRGRSAAFSLIRGIESQCDKSPACHFLRIQPGTLFLDRPERMPYDDGCVSFRIVKACRQIHVGNQRDVIPVFIEDLFHFDIRVCLECLGRLLRFRQCHAVLAPPCHSQYLVYLSVGQPVGLGMADVRPQFVVHTVTHGKGCYCGKLTRLPVKVVAPEDVTEQVCFQVFVNGGRELQYRSLCIPAEQLALVGGTELHAVPLRQRRRKFAFLVVDTFVLAFF